VDRQEGLDNRELAAHLERLVPKDPKDRLELLGRLEPPVLAASLDQVALVVPQDLKALLVPAALMGCPV